LQKKLTDRFVDNGGKLSKSDIQDLVPDIPADKVKTYVEKLQKAWQAAGKDKTKFEQLRQAFTGVKSIAITAPMAAAALAAAKREREQ
jgi:dTDP-4-amino-4,6-dideoxygalactose transaminase